MDEEFIKKQRRLARELRNSRWWKNLCASGVCCYYCHTPLKPDEVTMDHVIPISEGGLSTKGNVVPCCKKCNSEKKASSIIDTLLKQAQKN